MLDRICGNNHDLFSHTKVLRRSLPLDTTTNEPESVELPLNYLSGKKELGVRFEETIRSKILTRFIKGRISLTLMETIITIPR